MWDIATSFHVAAQVLVLERYTLFNYRGSSGDMVRMFRVMYTEDYLADLALKVRLRLTRSVILAPPSSHLKPAMPGSWRTRFGGRMPAALFCVCPTHVHQLCSLGPLRDFASSDMTDIA